MKGPAWVRKLDPKGGMIYIRGQITVKRPFGKKKWLIFEDGRMHPWMSSYATAKDAMREVDYSYPLL